MNYKQHEYQRKPDLGNHVLGLAYVISKHGNCLERITGVLYKNSKTESALTWSGLGNHLKEENKSFYTPEDNYVRKFIRETVKRDRVNALNRSFVSSSFTNIIENCEKYFGERLEIPVLFENGFRLIIKVKKFYEKKYELRFSDYRSINKEPFENYNIRKTCEFTNIKWITKFDKLNVLLSIDYNSFYPSEMAPKIQNGLKIEITEAIAKEDSNRPCELFNSGEWK